MAEAPSIRAIWSEMSDELAAGLLTDTRTATPDLYRQAQTTAAAAMHMRPQVFRQKPVPWQAGNVRRTLTRVGQDDLGARLLIEWLTKTQTPMLTQFLDELGLEHEAGAIKDEVGEQPDRATLAAAVSHLHQQYPHEAVRVYLRSFCLITAYDWPDLPALIDAEPDTPAPDGSPTAASGSAAPATGATTAAGPGAVSGGTDGEDAATVEGTSV